MKEIKISIIIPTYNDMETIKETFYSIISQTYINYEVIIVNDGSTDDTEKIVNDYIKENKLENKFKYAFQENADQLNAIKTALKYVSGDYIYILHSDDEFVDNSVLSKLVNECKRHPGIEAFTTKFMPIIDENSNQKDIRDIRVFNEKRNYIKELILIGGGNIFIDFALFRTDVFLRNVYYNYLTWNRPYWANIEENTTLKIKSLDFAIFKYRVFDGNYINSELGVINVYNGVLRTFVDATQIYDFPFFNLQRFMYRVCSKFKRPWLMRGYSYHRIMKNKYKAIKSILPKQVCNYLYYKSILGFYKNYKSNRVITILDLPKNIYVGSDVREFNKLMLKNKLPEFYVSFMKEVEIGFGKILINKKDMEKVKDLLHFFCLKNVEICEDNDEI